MRSVKCSHCDGTGRLTTPGALLREWRKRHGLRQGELAREVGVTQSYICNIEMGKMPFPRWARDLIGGQQ